jgi:WXG100 family type VII secretion target
MAMTAELLVSYDIVLAKAGEMSNIRSQLSSTMEELKSTVSSLTSSWESEASATFQSNFTKAHSEIEAMLNIVDEYAKDLTEVADGYRTAEGVVNEAAAALPSVAF